MVIFPSISFIQIPVSIGEKELKVTSETNRPSGKIDATDFTRPRNPLRIEEIVKTA